MKGGGTLAYEAVYPVFYEHVGGVERVVMMVERQ